LGLKKRLIKSFWAEFQIFKVFITHKVTFSFLDCLLDDDSKVFVCFAVVIGYYHFFIELISFPFQACPFRANPAPSQDSSQPSAKSL
jgi:hypothetical protein